MTLDPRLLKKPSVKALRSLLPPAMRRWSAQDVALSPADRYRREVELEEAIRTLPGELRTVFELSYWHDLVHAEIAEALGVPLGTVAARLSRATEKLRHLLVTQKAD
jgi:RNA polymerase sigma-70 factor (ECF subfamily)